MCRQTMSMFAFFHICILCRVSFCSGKARNQGDYNVKDQDVENEKPSQQNQRNHRVHQRNIWSHERKPGKGGHKRHKGKIDMAEVHGSTNEIPTYSS